MIRALVLAAAAIAGCSPEPTRIVIAASTDLRVPEDVDRIHFEVDARDVGSGVSGRTADLEDVEQPVELSVIHERGPHGPLDVRVAVLSGTDSVVERRVRTSFVPGRTVLLSLVLSRACAGVTCPGETTCEAGECVPIDLDPGVLPPYTPPDAGPIAADGGRDAGACGAGCACHASCADRSCTCESGCSCELSCPAGQDCESIACDGASCAIDGRGASNLAVDCAGGATCAIDARDASNALGLVCREGSTCDVDCSDTSNCQLRCESGSRCQLRCHHASNCEIQCEGGSRQECGRDREVCGRSCD